MYNRIASHLMKEKTEPVTIRLTPTIRAKVQALADAERRTFSQFVGLVLERFLDEREAPQKK